jgi:carboxyl-terminal processing protease
VTPGVLVASNTEDAAVAEDDTTTASESKPPLQKPNVTVDEQLSKALDLLKNKAA